MFRKNNPLQKDSTLKETSWYQWGNVVNSARKKRLEKVLKETLLMMCMTHFVHDCHHLFHTITSNKNKLKLICEI